MKRILDKKLHYWGWNGSAFGPILVNFKEGMLFQYAKENLRTRVEQRGRFVSWKRE
ncbi:MAG: hypothetical protein KDA68_19920 [Planctomycetaceae bacterium]|nr:hypothetical protein [Planctomycetaceae bacterium]